MYDYDDEKPYTSGSTYTRDVVATYWTNKATREEAKEAAAELQKYVQDGTEFELIEHTEEEDFGTILVVMVFVWRELSAYARHDAPDPEHWGEYFLPENNKEYLEWVDGCIPEPKGWELEVEAE